jgi:hypothetical protein
VHVLRADARLARELLGFSGEIDIERYVDWFRARHQKPALLLESEIKNWEMPDEVGGGVIAFRSPADFVTSGPLSGG